MAEPSRIVGEQHFTGAVTFLSTVTLADGTITDGKVASGADIAATKLEHQYSKVLRASQSLASLRGCIDVASH